MKLHIFDVKQLMYVGQSKKETVCRGVIEDQGKYRPNEIRVGSICYMFEKMAKFMNKTTNVLCFCCDSRPQYKIDLLKEVFGMTYKGGRPKTPEHVTYQFKFAVELLKQMGFLVYKEEDYEADDLIASIVMKYSKVFDEVIVYTNDSDQYHLIDSNVRCEAVSEYCRDVDLSGYVDACSKKRNTPYNRVMLNKMLYGETGDNIPRLGDSYVKMVDKCIPDVVNRYLGDNRILNTIVKAFSQDGKKAMCVCEMILPRLIYDERTLVDAGKQPDWNLFMFYAIAFGCRTYRGHALPDNELGESTILTAIERVNG